ncbi:MAG TPA: permease-like cell division protein FtsX, partial [Blastocatellia bacterium]|nr:permease-like cell division protein FtsX [Blastocatellia bacterium]
MVTSITLSVITGILLSQAVLANSLAQIESKVDITVYFTTNAPETDIVELKSRIEKLPEVSEVAYVSREEALEDFKAKHANDYLTIQALDEIGENPLGALLNIRAKDPAQYEGVAKFLENASALSSDGSSIVDKINYNQNKVVIDRLTDLINGARKLGFILTLVLVIISVLIMFNTISLTIFFAREEISIMRLVGAENRYIRGPFMVEGIIYGVTAAIFTTLLYIPLTMWLGNNMAGFLGLNLW